MSIHIPGISALPFPGSGGTAARTVSEFCQRIATLGKLVGVPRRTRKALFAQYADQVDGMLAPAEPRRRGTLGEP